MPTTKQFLRLSEYFGLGTSQALLDCVDIPLEADIRLFVDPYALSISPDPWIQECSDLVISYFQLLLEHIRENRDEDAMSMLRHLREPNDTHLGMSRGVAAGRGVGPDQAGDLFSRLKNSKAANSGQLRDLSACELHIPNISSDKISDITINVIRLKLIEYTQQQCSALGIPVETVPSGMYWDGEHQTWANAYVQLPVYKDERIVLVPEAAVRYRLSVDH